jgi:hypothetical protein
MLIMAIFSIVQTSLDRETVHAQSVQELQRNFSGEVAWDQRQGCLTFTRSGEVSFDKRAHKDHYWDVPQAVSRIVIERDVQVTAAFHTRHDCLIEGVDRKTSVVFGTREQKWAESRGVKPYQYCQFQNRGGVLTIKNLTARNPFAFFVRGWGHVCHAKDCNFIDDRGGWGNHSDGFEGGHGSTVDGCHFETGDDAIKLYFDITVTNTSIKMIQNCVPFQFGWGSYQASKSTIKNVTITGDWGRGKVCPVFQWVQGNDRKAVHIDGLKIENLNASLFELNSQGQLDLEIENALIDVSQYGTANFSGTRKICGNAQQKNLYKCASEEMAAGSQ